MAEEIDADGSQRHRWRQQHSKKSNQMTGNTLQSTSHYKGTMTLLLNSFLVSNGISAAMWWRRMFWPCGVLLALFHWPHIVVKCGI